MEKHTSERLAERTRWLNDKPMHSDRHWVLYWMHHAMRGHENPALDVAIHLAHQLDVPLLVFQSLPQTFPWASRRRHTFILEGAVDVAVELDALGVSYTFWLQTADDDRPGLLGELAAGAACVVTDDMPVETFPHATRMLAQTTDVAVAAVDTACVVPTRLVEGAPERAFEYRDHTQAMRDQRVDLPWPETAYRGGRVNQAYLPFTPLVLDVERLQTLLDGCAIDHTIGPVPHTRGGARAGYARWERFKRTGLKHYAGRRNDPCQLDSVSRMSAYLHFGMVSPMRLARDARSLPGKGPQKFLEELLIWRELAYAWCFHQPAHARLDALPDWARQTLRDHEADSRDRLMSWETLTRAKSGDALWDAAQRSLLVHGELHNNVRMTWGKAIPHWTPDARAALARLVDLNHRYALDGCDPASYGGLLWCLGLFDRPFRPEQPVMGVVRGRSTDEHARRLDVTRYARLTSRPLVEHPPRIAVVGAGLAGLTAGRTLHDHGYDVTVLDKARGPAGRLATRRADQGLTFDHGAQYFTVRDERFERYVRSWIDDGLVAEWCPRLATITLAGVVTRTSEHPRYVGIPGMSAVGKHLAADLNVLTGVCVTAMTRQPNPANDGARPTWTLVDDQQQEHGPFDVVLLTAPAPQTAKLLATSPEQTGVLLTDVRQAAMTGCWALMVAFKTPVDVPIDGAFVEVGPLTWVARNSSKPGRAASTDAWVLHASPSWSEERIDEAPEAVAGPMLEAFREAVGLTALPEVTYRAAHRWRFAQPRASLAEPSRFDRAAALGVAGDWCGAPRVEGAFLAGADLAGRVMGWIADAHAPYEPGRPEPSPSLFAPPSSPEATP